MKKTVSVEIKPTPKDVAELIWNMDSEQQAEMFKHLHDLAGSNHTLMMQFMTVRDECAERGDNSLDAFQSMFSSAFKYCW